MMSEPLPSGWHSAPSEARRWIWGPSSPPTSFPPAPLPVFLVPSPRPPFHLSLSSLHFISFRSPPLLLLASGRGALRCCAPQQEQTSPRGRHGATESRWMDLSEPFLRSPGIITGPPWGFTRPEVRHQRDTCSTLTIIAAQASALSFFVRSLSYRFFSLSFPFSLSLSCPHPWLDQCCQCFDPRVSCVFVLESWFRRNNCEIHSGLRSVRRIIILIIVRI